MKFFIDLDDTLINSTILNNDAYNFALESCGFKRVVTNSRITREKLSNYKKLNEIIQLKQKYFMSNWLPYRILINMDMIRRIDTIGKNNCYLWTKADRNRANYILDMCNLRKLFAGIIFDEKKDFKESIKTLKEKFILDEFVIYENNHNFFKNKKCSIIDTIINSQFNVKGYLIR